MTLADFHCEVESCGVRVERGFIVCPFHADTSPSCHLFLGKTGTPRYHCHACGASGPRVKLLRALGAFAKGEKESWDHQAKARDYATAAAIRDNEREYVRLLHAAPWAEGDVHPSVIQEACILFSRPLIADKFTFACYAEIGLIHSIQEWEFNILGRSALRAGRATQDPVPVIRGVIQQSDLRHLREDVINRAKRWLRMLQHWQPWMEDENAI